MNDRLGDRATLAWPVLRSEFTLLWVNEQGHEQAIQAMSTTIHHSATIGPSVYTFNRILRLGDRDEIG
jgi:hypothetical protein